MRHGYEITQYACAVLLIISSIALACVTAVENNDIANGILLYIAQAFLLAGSIFGLEYYVHKITSKLNHGTQETTAEGAPK
mgnify:FL=1